MTACSAAIHAASASLRGHSTESDKETLWESQLDDLLAKGSHPTLRADERADTAFRAAGWYEMPEDPFSVRWWSGTAWVGQPVPLTVSMLAA